MEQATGNTELENMNRNDIVFLNSPEKPDIPVVQHDTIRNWFEYAMLNFPRQQYFGITNDRAFLCTPTILEKLKNLADDRLYYGWYNQFGSKCPFDVDEMFLIAGRRLAASILKQQHREANHSIESHCLVGSAGF